MQSGVYTDAAAIFEQSWALQRRFTLLNTLELFVAVVSSFEKSHKLQSR